MKNVYDFLESLNILEDDYIVIAVSGGPDSMALLDILLNFTNKIKFNIVCAHVNHKLRIESEQEAINVKSFCDENNIVFEYLEIKEYKKENFHNQARKIRYKFFEDLIKKYNSKYLFTAHHGDDLMETILMRIVRGSTLGGYAGINTVTRCNNYKIIRPLLSLTKKDLLDYVESKQMWYAKDMSNQKDVYTRNRFRKNILTQLKKEKENVHLNFYNFSKELILSNEYIQKCAKKEFNNVYNNEEIDIIKFNDLEYIIQKNIIYIYLQKIYNENLNYINNKHVDNIIAFIQKGKNGYIDLPLDYKAFINYSKIKIEKNIITQEYEYVICEDTKLPNGKQIKILSESNDTDNDIIYLNSKEISLPLKVRTKKSGDLIEVKNLNGSKKVKNIFIDSKISKNQRETWPIVLDNDGKILWIPGIKKSKFDRQNTNNYDIILKYS